MFRLWLIGLRENFWLFGRWVGYLFAELIARVAFVLRVCYGGGGSAERFPRKDSLLSVCGNFGLTVPCNPIDTGIGGGMRDLSFQICCGGSVRFLSVADSSNVHACIHSLFFVLIGTMRRLCPRNDVSLRRPVSGKCFYGLRVSHAVKLSSIRHVGRGVRRVVTTSVPCAHARDRARRIIHLFRGQKVVSGTQLLSACNRLCSCCCRLNSAISYCCDDLMPDAKCVHLFSVIGCCSKLLLHVPDHRGPAGLRRIIGRRGVLRIFRRCRH